MNLVPNPALLIYVAAYGIIMIGLGIWYSRRIQSSDDFVLAGRSLGPVVLAGTLLATFSGSGSVTGGSNSLGFSYGFWPAVIIVVSPGLITFGLLYFIAPKIRAYGKYTISQVLEDQYGQAAKVLSAVIIILAYVGIVSYQFKGLGFVLNATTGMPVEIGTMIAAVLVIFLAMIGGLMAVAPTDALSALLMLAGLLAAVPAVLLASGGWDHIAAGLPAENLSLTGSLSPVQMAAFIIPFVFLMLGDQNIYQRLASSKGAGSAKSAIIGWMIASLFVFTAIPLIAMMARSVFPDIQPGMALISTTTIIPSFFGGILLAAVTAFIVTTGNSYLLSGATSLTYDVYLRFFRPQATPREILLVTKAAIPVLGLISYIMLRFFPTILQVQMLSYAVYGAGITPAVLAVFLWPRVTRPAGLTSMIVGVLATTVWEVLKPIDVMGALVAVPLAIITLIVITLITTNRDGSSRKIQFKTLLLAQIFYLVLGAGYNVVSMIIAAMGGVPLSATNPGVGLVSMLAFGILLIPAFLGRIGIYRALMILAIAVYGYGGIYLHVANVMAGGMHMYSSSLALVLAIGINVFGLILNIIAVAGWFARPGLALNKSAA